MRERPGVDRNVWSGVAWAFVLYLVAGVVFVIALVLASRLT